MISIIVTVYNIEKYVDKCINSILSQTYGNFELILVDDGSVDMSGQICDKYAECDERIRVIHKTNSGQVEARHVGAKTALGEYIICIDGDDWIGPDRLGLLARSIEISGADLIFMDGIIRVYDAGKEEVDVHCFDERTFNPKEVLELLANPGYCFKRVLSATTCSWAVRRSLFLKTMERVDKEVLVGEDFLFTWLALLYSESVYLSKNVSYYYVQREGSLSRKADDSVIEPIRKAYLHICKELDQLPNATRLREVLVMATMRIIVATSFNRVLMQSEGYLYPYSQITDGTKILVYGAGDVGVRLISFLVNSAQYKIVGWLDKYSNKKRINGIDKIEFEDLIHCDFDYIAIAVADYDVVKAIKKDLLLRGVDDSKIAFMDAKVIDEEHLLNIMNTK